MGYSVVLVPDALHVAIDRFVYFEEFLELINKECYRTLYRESHQVFKDFRKAFCFTHCRYA